MKNWDELLSSSEFDHDFKEIVTDFLISYEISFEKFIPNFNSLLSYESRLSMVASGEISKSLRLERAFPPFYPNWFIAGFPDVVVWILNYPKKSVISKLSEEKFLQITSDNDEEKKFIHVLIQDYISKTDEILECSKNYEKDIINKSSKFPIQEFNTEGQLIKEIKLEREYEITYQYFYNEGGHISSINRYGKDPYGDFEQTPYRLFEYDKNGLLVKATKYGFGGSISKDVQFINKYKNENDLISRIGPNEKIKGFMTDQEYKLHFKYLTSEVEIYYTNFYKNLAVDFGVEGKILEKVKRENLIKTLNSYSGFDEFK